MGAAKRNYSSSRISGSSRGGLVEIKWFFDKPAVLAATSVSTRQVLSKFGAYVRATARQSIRKPRRLKPSEMTKWQRQRWHQRGEPVEYAPSRPGEPPRNRTGKLKDFIFFYYDPDTQSVVVGPAAFPSSRRGTPAVIEFGGTIITGPGRGRAMAARPFMGPALERELPGLSAMWRNSVSAKA